MTVEQWLSTRSPQPPAELAAALSRAVGSVEVSEGDIAARLMSAARELLPRVLDGECTGRSSALELLTLDALITFALEAGSDTAADCERLAGRLLAMIGDASSQ